MKFVIPPKSDKKTRVSPGFFIAPSRRASGLFVSYKGTISKI